MTAVSAASAADPAAIERAVGHTFRNRELLTRSFIHSSAAKRGDRGNERLEFLGDRVLGLIVADLLLRHFPEENEGSLAKRHAVLVSRESLARVAVSINLGRHLILAKGEEETGTRENITVLADAMEALIAALYRDGGLEVARQFVERDWAPLMNEATAPPQDPKTQLQEWALGRALPLPSYQVIRQDGPDHDPLFEVAVTIKGHAPAVGSGRSKRAAERVAATRLLESLQ